MQKSFWLVMTLVLAGMIGLFVATSDSSSDSDLENYDPTVLQVDDYIDGVSVSTQEELDAAREGRVEIIEYGDFQCPACAFFASVMEQIKIDYGDQVIVAFRHFPLTNIHPQAMTAHRAVEAAGQQGVFWDMHDLVYAEQNAWSGFGNAADILEGLATQVGVEDLEQYKTDRDATSIFDEIDNDIDSASSLNITATPTLLINGEKLDTTPSYEELRNIIDAEIAELENPETT